MHHQLNPQAKALLDQWAADAASKPQPAHLLSLNEQIAASRLAFHRLDPLAGEPESVLHIVQRTLPGPGGPLLFASISHVTRRVCLSLSICMEEAA